jgi:flavin-dependent dehydrogenase
MYDLIIIGAGPGGIALAAEAQASGVDTARTLVLEKAATQLGDKAVVPGAKADWLITKIPANAEKNYFRLVVTPLERR